MSSKLDHDFIEHLAKHGESNKRFKWYITAIVALSSFNYPEKIGPLYLHLLEHYIAREIHVEQTRKIREGLVKSAGPHGAAKTRYITFRSFTDESVSDDDDHLSALARGDAFLKSLYRDVPDLNTDDDFIMDKLESSQAIITTLISIDCKGQARNHMKGMMWNGATREEVTNIRDSIVLLADHLSIAFRDGAVQVPPDPINS
ncbi:uncharacterized protein N7483_000020 [Penicillium malachiteum]|uniref:uncharacterized protein n=1 Tax=Penicillium malachiteum TaxID=1324776 RepID=UPI0025479060|nr:uncharacterized protein N7483_000020 [Penicillium malachiteum]KAJ5734895.1 hypothetical protein N7483_000020 [Penicillium malachiteum]